MTNKRLRAAWGDKLLTDEPLAKHTTFGIGGPADFFVVAHTAAELCNYVRLARVECAPYFILGTGANLLVSDQGIRGLVIQNQAGSIEFTPDPEAIPSSEMAWLGKAESGAALSELARRAVERGLANLEWAVDVPGTVGGAVVGNAGAFGGYVSDSLRGVSVFNGEGERWLPACQLGLTYRNSVFKKGKKAADLPAVILSAHFSLREQDAEALRAKAIEYTSRRAESQPHGRSAGSVFKRTAQYPAGFLIENAGLKGARVGGAVVSPRHANFIVNEGTASALDVLDLIELVRTVVYDKFKVRLELEIELVGEWQDAYCLTPRKACVRCASTLGTASGTKPG